MLDFDVFNECVTDQPTDRQTDTAYYRDAKTHLKTNSKVSFLLATTGSSSHVVLFILSFSLIVRVPFYRYEILVLKYVKVILFAVVCLVLYLVRPVIRTCLFLSFTVASKPPDIFY